MGFDSVQADRRKYSGAFKYDPERPHQVSIVVLYESFRAIASFILLYSLLYDNDVLFNCYLTEQRNWANHSFQ